MKVTVTFDISKEDRLLISQYENGRASGLAGKELCEKHIRDTVGLDLARRRLNATPQKAVYKSVVERGYHEGYLPEQFLYRQLFKMTEELAEAVEAMGARTDLQTDGKDSYYKLFEFLRTMEEAGSLARDLFDNADPAIYKKQPSDFKGFKSEMSDMQVVLFCMAEAYSDSTADYCDVTDEAMYKAIKDVERGVR